MRSPQHPNARCLSSQEVPLANRDVVACAPCFPRKHLDSRDVLGEFRLGSLNVSGKQTANIAQAFGNELPDVPNLR
jgi:hypothetical protein